MILPDGQHSFLSGRVLVWFSCGAASAVALKMAVDKYGKQGVHAFNSPIAQESEDNGRFLADVSRWIGVAIHSAKSEDFPSGDIYEVFNAYRFIADRNGARCTRVLKREVRKRIQAPEDTHVIGFTADEKHRVAVFEEQNPIFVDWLLVDSGITKADCFRVISDAGIELPLLYRQGYKNNNCIGCVKGGAGYWNKVRKDYPEQFQEMAEFSRSLGVRLIKVRGERVFLDELPEGVGRYEAESSVECGPACKTETEES